eukprot:CAMPEP_0198242446 /NCGR_PEP_ID=MMETSP1446-20131203/16552_1 /TAXON_ID=1461542 ORGANISM="Unidentified sp, Strain CCMP2111" /NCGR_SAMPLE_ID=MMETSP1446 /ASSEMBLY_ACC=CAM_ASM_001112 /LENGTH=233 /DNA_ID=CAMNT_0043925915 /DNA_START=17 /DNA_END=718 /DNA_ORIENTATION=+
MDGGEVEDLEALLDDALNDFQELKEQSTPKTKQKGKGPKFDPLGNVSRKTSKKKASSSKTAQEKASEAPREGETRVEEALEGDDADNLLSKLAEDFSGMENADQLQNIVGSVMKQLLSKEVLYDPLKEISAKYPLWLEENKDKVSGEDFRRFSQQHIHIQKLCEVYEASDDNFDEVVQLMQDVQSCGQPPEEIIRELAPDLQIGPDGLPVQNDEKVDPMQILEGMDPSKCAMQ